MINNTHEIERLKKQIWLIQTVTLPKINEKIESNKQINDNLEQQAVLKVDQYFSATTKIVALSEIMDFVNGFAFQSSTYLPVGQYRIITIKNGVVKVFC